MGFDLRINRKAWLVPTRLYRVGGNFGLSLDLRGGRMELKQRLVVKSDSS